MCSWCWGFAPVLEELLDKTGLPLELVVGGLRPGPAAEILGAGMRRYLEREWATIAERTGQAFDPGILDDLGDEWLYDTEPADMAVVHMRSLAPERALAFFARVQRAFYVERTDVTDLGTYMALAQEFDVDPGDFVAALGGEQLRKQTWRDFATARRWGVTGFPTLLFRREGRLGLVTTGYRPASELTPVITPLL
jgi:putative protein-disulfide isomerase